MRVHGHVSIRAGAIFCRLAMGYHKNARNNRGIHTRHGNIFKLRISGFQALAIQAAHKLCLR